MIKAFSVRSRYYVELARMLGDGGRWQERTLKKKMLPFWLVLCRNYWRDIDAAVLLA